MHFHFKGLGHSAWIILVGAFLFLRPRFEYFSHDRDNLLMKHIKGAALLLAGTITYIIAARTDKKNGIEILTHSA
jgi:hypothetical protein